MIRSNVQIFMIASNAVNKNATGTSVNSVADQEFPTIPRGPKTHQLHKKHRKTQTWMKLVGTSRLYYKNLRQIKTIYSFKFRPTTYAVITANRGARAWVLVHFGLPATGNSDASTGRNSWTRPQAKRAGNAILNFNSVSRDIQAVSKPVLALEETFS